MDASEDIDYVQSKMSSMSRKRTTCLSDLEYRRDFRVDGWPKSESSFTFCWLSVDN